MQLGETRIKSIVSGESPVFLKLSKKASCPKHLQIGLEKELRLSNTFCNHARNSFLVIPTSSFFRWSHRPQFHVINIRPTLHNMPIFKKELLEPKRLEHKIQKPMERKGQDCLSFDTFLPYASHAFL